MRWQALRDAAVAGDEIPAAVLVLADGTIVVSGTGGPVTRDILGNSYMQGVTAGYSSNGTLLWEAFSKLPTVWATALPNGDVCATGGYDALTTCWRVPGLASNQPPTSVMTAAPSSGTAPLTVTFDAAGSTDPDGTVTSWAWSFGDGFFGTGAVTTHTYTTPGMTYTASLTVGDNGGASSMSTRSIVVNALSSLVAPTNLTATALTGSSIVLKWTNRMTNQLSVRIERCTGSGCTNFVQVAALAGTAATFTDNRLAARTTYTYRVRAYTALGASPYSNIASAKTLRR